MVQCFILLLNLAFVTFFFVTFPNMIWTALPAIVYVRPFIFSLSPFLILNDLFHNIHQSFPPLPVLWHVTFTRCWANHTSSYHVSWWNCAQIKHKQKNQRTPPTRITTTNNRSPGSGRWPLPEVGANDKTVIGKSSNDNILIVPPAYSTQLNDRTSRECDVESWSRCSADTNSQFQ